MSATLQENLENYLTCPICLELFPFTPLAVDCQHNYCATCLINYLEVLESDYHNLLDTSSRQVPGCPSCRAPICSARPNTLLGNILADYYAIYPEKQNPEARCIDLSEATAICGELLRRYTPGMIIPPREVDGMIVCVLHRVTPGQYERYRNEGRGAGMIWTWQEPENLSGSPPPSFGNNTPWSGASPLESPVPEYVHSRNTGTSVNVSVRTDSQTPTITIISEAELTFYEDNGEVTQDNSYASSEGFLDGDGTGAPVPDTFLYAEDHRQARYFVMRSSDWWLGGTDGWALDEIWGNWHTDRS